MYKRQGAERAVRVELGAFAEAAQGGRDAPFGIAAAARVVAGQEVSVRGEFLGAGPVEQGFRGADPALQGAQVREGEVDGLADAGGRREVEGLREVPEAAGGCDGDLSMVGALPAGEQPEQGGLA